MVYAHHVGGPPKQCKTTGFHFCKRTQTTGTEAKMQSVVCSEVTVWNYLGQTCGLGKLSHCYPFVVLNKHLENGRAAKANNTPS